MKEGRNTEKKEGREGGREDSEGRKVHVGRQAGLRRQVGR